MCSCSQEKGAKLRDAKGHEMEVDGSFVHCLLCGRYKMSYICLLWLTAELFRKVWYRPNPRTHWLIGGKSWFGEEKKKKNIYTTEKNLDFFKDWASSLQSLVIPSGWATVVLEKWRTSRLKSVSMLQVLSGQDDFQKQPSFLSFPNFVSFTSFPYIRWCGGNSVTIESMTLTTNMS